MTSNENSILLKENYSERNVNKAKEFFNLTFDENDRFKLEIYKLDVRLLSWQTYPCGKSL